ncbi:MAG TPA: phosphate starvation-inducible protein PhoH [Cryomorphaceae bacterium]|nr:phosphate starvation-inducible protein PhoH [Owenweeksia sp.]MBG00503.1 phosphate starvation-inducible protein PhoH [Owenweeksia sp.]HAD96924.1 phosphate starvation-inducible protein PhoH [Cryomorphaceae bacterium]HCQ17105.1 phosphate starvation-inducible protein PhoH [Cryomorphaceae bacterium]
MIEKNIQIENADPRDVYGSNNTYLNIIQSYFPELKITARGHTLKVNGEPTQITAFEEKIEEILNHLHRFNSLTSNQLERIMKDEMDRGPQSEKDSDIIMFGTHGQAIKARTQNQRKMVQAIDESDMVFAIGPAGTGKTYTAVALAVRALKNKEVRSIILTRPAVEAGENLGFLPGDLKEKLDPYLQPLYDALRDMIPPEKLNFYLESGTIQIAPLAFMRGRTLDRAFVILDEAQNTTHSQMKMFLTRMGSDAKFIITGDASQIDLPRKQRSGLVEAMRILDKIKGISFVRLNQQDVIRHRLVKNIINAYEVEENKSEPSKTKSKADESTAGN